MDVPELKQKDLKAILFKNYMKHDIETNALFLLHETRFRLWLFYLQEGCNLLMYGLGSKINVLSHFHKKMLSDYYVCTLHGYLPSLTIKDIFNSLVVDILKEKKCPTNINETLSLIEGLLKREKKTIFLIIHNIDGVALRRNNYCEVLSKLASFKNIHLIATMDHINGSLMWSPSLLNRFKFLCINVTTYQPYLNETSFEHSVQLAHSDKDLVSLSSLKEIFKPLTDKSKKIFKILAKDYLENRRKKHYKSMTYDEWYTQSRKSFFTNGKNLFRIQIREFVDHNIIKIGSNGIHIKISPDDLSTFYTQQFPDD